MLVSTAIIIIILLLGLYVAGLFFNGNALYLAGAGSILMIIFGVLMFNNPVQEKIGNNITDINDTNTVTTYIYQDIDSRFNNGLATTIIIIGFMGIFLPLSMYRKSQFSKADSGEY